MSHSHSPPVQLHTPSFLGELKAGYLEDVEEAVAHHVGDGVVHSPKALTETEGKDTLVRSCEDTGCVRSENGAQCDDF